MIEHQYADVNGLRLHYATAGSGKLFMFLHGFPEFWYAWKNQLAEFGRDYQAVAPDLRGYNLSSKPAPVEQYQLQHLVKDVRALAEHLGHRKFFLAGHDWGGVVAWAFALSHPEALEKLVIMNAPHPGVSIRELKHNPAQRKASQYINLFRTPMAEMLLSPANFAALTEEILKPGLAKGYFTEEDHKAYLEAWSQPGALTGGLNYYRALPFSRLSEETFELPPGAQPPRDALIVKTPTLVIWGERDKYLLTGNLEGLEEYVLNLTLRRVPDASHWVVHEKPTLVNALIREFVTTGTQSRSAATSS